MRIKTTAFLFAGLYIAAFTAHAQKLPKVQSTGLRVPADIKIDGNIDEWGNKFEAYNKATQIFYSIANDNDHLYLMVHIPNNIIINKAVAGGITLTVSKSSQKGDSTKIAVTFPQFYKQDRAYNISFNYKSSLLNDSLQNKEKIDSVRQSFIRKLSYRAKLIGIEGVKGFQDNVISVYNSGNIKAAASFDHMLAYNYELSFPLSYLGFKTVVNKTELYYQIQLNGLIADGTFITTLPGRPDHFIFTQSDGSTYSMGQGPEVLELMSPTNFSGEYNLLMK